ncbi:MAG: hypothetical protein KGN34_10065 [Sphingomonadales bacterium]|nr:hypothetical protein [Sphingomonadales bacterium]
MACFADDPAEWFRGSSAAATHLPLHEQEALQLEALQARFAAMRDRIVPLKALADAARIDEIRTIDDVAPLLFPHGLFKTFPQHLVESLRFAPLTEWLSRLSLHDFSALDGRSFGSADAWMDAIDSETDVLVTHSSGTTGALSLYARGKLETERLYAFSRMTLDEWVAQDGVARDAMDLAVLWLSYAGGRSAVLRGADWYRRSVAATPEQFYPLLPSRLSTDWQLYIMRAEAARQGRAAAPQPSDYVQQKLDEAADQHRTHAERTRFLLDALRHGLHDTRVILVGGPHNVFRFAEEGLGMGMAPGLRKGSVVRTFGGLKGFPEPQGMEATMKRFGGVDHLVNTYGMTEITTGHHCCREGHYHVMPWVLPMVLDPATGALLPRSGRQKGRAAFFDLVAQSYWGGVVSADVVEMDWGGCACGRTTPHILPQITRVPAPEPDEHAIGAASPAAVHAALHALNRDIA